jgi:hypothetical protein
MEHCRGGGSVTARGRCEGFFLGGGGGKQSPLSKGSIVTELNMEELPPSDNGKLRSTYQRG